MATSTVFNRKVEECIKQLFLHEYPHMKLSSVNKLATNSTQVIACEAVKAFREDCRGVRNITLSDLPAEIRNRIYEFAVTPSHGGALFIGSDFSHYIVHRRQEVQLLKTSAIYGTKWKTQAVPAITQVSRELRRHTLPMYYGLNEFVALAPGGHVPLLRDGTQELITWLARTGKTRVQRMKKLTVVATHDMQFAKARLNARLASLGVELPGRTDFVLLEEKKV